MTTNLTPSLIADRLKQAAHTMRRLPPVKVSGYRAWWPEIVVEFSDIVGAKVATVVKLGPPSARHISEMDEALEWLKFLKTQEAKLVWRRARGQKWRKIAKAHGKSIRTAQALWLESIIVIHTQLKLPVLRRCFPYKILP